MQGAAFRFGLILTVLIAIPSVADCKCRSEHKASIKKQDDTASHHQSASYAGPAPVPWKPPWPTFIAEEKTAAPSDGENAGNQPSQCHDADSYTKRSTDAAEAQAKYAGWQFYLGIVSLAVGIFAAAFTGWAAYAAGAAAKAAAKATNEAVEANNIAKDTAKRQLRAYVFAARAKITFTENSVVVNIAIVNSGQTPAYNFDHVTEIVVSILPFEPDYIANNHVRTRNGDSIPPGGNSGVIAERIGLSKDRIELASSGITPTIVEGMIWYDDAFNDHHVTEFRFVYRGDKTDPPGIMMAAEEGNRAT